MKKFTLLLLVLLMLAGCAQMPTIAATPVITPTPLPTPSSTPAPPMPTATPTAVPTVAPSGLDTQGPWLVFEGETGLYAANASGEGGGVTLFGIRPQQWSVSPRGRTIAVLTMDSEDLQGSLLYLISFPGGQVRELSMLTNADTEPQPGMGAGDPPYEAARAIIDQPNIAWSPDGYTLAFISAFAGESADLYTYDIRLNKFTRLTDGASQAFAPSWSPDGELVAHLGASTFGTGAGFDMDGGWVVRLADKKIFDMYTIDPKSQGDEILGWRDERWMLIRSFDEVCGWKNLRLYQPISLSSISLHVASFSEVWLASDGAILLNLQAGMNEVCKQVIPSGLYLFLPGANRSMQLFPIFSGEARWLPQLGIFLLLNDGQLYQLASNAKRTPLITPYNSLPEVSPSGKNWSWTLEDGVFLGLFGEQPRQIFDGVAHDLLWTPDGSALFFFGDSPSLGMGLFRAAAPGFAPQLVMPGVDGRSPAWLLP